MPAKQADIARDCSPFLQSLTTRHPDWFEQLSSSGRFEAVSAPDPLRLAELITGQGLEAGLRVFRNQEMMRIVWRELNRSVPLEETMSDLSALAVVCLQAAVGHHLEDLRDRHGTPLGRSGRPAGLAVLGLGKLGGGELNLSSDIDLVFAFTEGGECDGRRRLSNDQFFIRLVRAVINSLSEVTEHGFCFRVDTRLRPFGESGPLVCSFGAMEQYYQREGRDWERYALIKARPVAGDTVAGAELVALLKPFVYRRYIDFGAVEALHEMYLSLREDSARRDRASDIKRGPGGIREIEFLVQTFQLLRGGREPVLQTPSLLRALDALEGLGLLTPDTVSSLASGYHFLRRLENAIQALHDRQTHTLPAGSDLERVTRVMGFDSAGKLLGAVEETRARVLAHIETSFPEQAAPEPENAHSLRWRHLREMERQSVQESEDPWDLFMASLSRLKLSERASRRLDQFMPGLLAEIEERDPDRVVLGDVLNLVLAICRRSAYLSLLVQNPAALRRMLALFAASDWIAGVVIRHPALLDELIDPRLGKMLPDREEMDAGARRVLGSSPDTEGALLGLNHLKRSFGLRLAVAELESTLSARQAQRSLTGLAESVIESCYRLALEDIRERHGDLPGPGIGIIAYGSLGARELSYTSDLDLIFLYHHGEGESDGPRPLAPERYYTTVVRRLLSFLTASTASGRLYEVDTRLRPNGRSGLLVSSVGAFERYQKKDAWTWEMQALTRARPCAGSPQICSEFLALRREIIGRKRDAAALRAEVVEMRGRLREAHGEGDPFKHGPGGLVDMDFIAQMGVLEQAALHPEVMEAVGTLEQLQALAACGWLDELHLEVLSQNFDWMVRNRHGRLLARKKSEPAPPDEACREICRSFLG